MGKPCIKETHVFLIHIFTLLILDCKNSEWRKSYLYVSGSCSWLWFVHLLDGAWLLGGCADCECFLLDSLATTLSEGCDWTAALSDRHERENQLLYLHSCSSGTGKGGSPKKKKNHEAERFLFIYHTHSDPHKPWSWGQTRCVREIWRVFSWSRLQSQGRSYR